MIQLLLKMTLHKYVREILWLVGVLVVSAPLALGLGHIIGKVPLLLDAWRQVLAPPRYRAWLLYGLLVLACYLGRLAAAGAGRIATVAPRQRA